ncbi:hypothetical protein L1049_004165 [Liquidambar formosana]|uniref:Pectinesterase inhibitor domain-containing protein n=1 Tax=Liquidambar formosana TaxID=63359 RepID=A0AAP0RSD2_LIQFO
MILKLMLLSWLTHLASSASTKGDNYVQEACNVTQYRDLCIHSLSSFSNTAKRSPSKWARAGVSVTLSESKRAAQYLLDLKKNRQMRGRDRIALSDCMECFQDAIDNLHKSLGVLRELNGAAFSAQMSDVKTWMSAVLTDVDTCLDGFDDGRGNQTSLLRNRVLKVSYITSNALALVSKLANSSMQSQSTDP